MKNLFRSLGSSTLGFVLFLVTLSPANGMEGGAPLMVAKLTSDTPVVQDETAVFDKHNPKVKQVMAVQNRHTRDLLAIPEVVGTATGLDDTGSPVVLVFTRSEVPPGLVPASLDGVAAVVRVTGEIAALKPSGGGGGFSTTAVLAPPVPIGVSTGNVGECSAGTIGARVVSGSSVYALSNNHVYALENAASIGSHVLQPGLYDTQCVMRGNNDLGTLAAFVPIQFNNTGCDPVANRTACNSVDAAIALTTTAKVGNGTYTSGYGIPNYLTIAPSVGLPVQKFGRTTSLTKGTITGINATITVSYGTGRNAIFIDQIVISSGKPFSKAGDSGSLIVTNDSHANPVGLLFAGGSGTTIANPIDSVLGSLGVTIDGINR